MALLSTGATSLVGKPLATLIAKKFGVTVVERWTRYRAERFFEAFVRALQAESAASDKDSDVVDRQLTVMLADEEKSEVLFDAYRRVCFSKSKKLGPRIIGLLTARLVLEGRMADSEEERVLAAAELLSDGNLISFMKDYHDHRAKAEGITDASAEHYMIGDSVVVRWLQERLTFDCSTGDGADIGTFPWQEALGDWAVNAARCGLIHDRIQQTSRRSRLSRYEEDRDRPIVITTTTITFGSACALLYRLIVRSLAGEEIDSQR